MPPHAWQKVVESVESNSLRFGFAGLDQPDALRRHRAIAAEAWRIELTTPRTIMESYKMLRVGATEIEQHRDGLFVLDPIPVLMSQVGLFDRSKPRRRRVTTSPRARTRTSKPNSFDANFLWMVTDASE